MRGTNTPKRVAAWHTHNTIDQVQTPARKLSGIAGTGICMLSWGLTIVFLSRVFVVELVQDRVFQDASLGSLSFVSAATSSVCSIQRMKQGDL